MDRNPDRHPEPQRFFYSVVFCVCFRTYCRVLIQDKGLDLFVEKLKVAMEKQLVLGDGFDDGITQGALINKSQYR